MISSTMVNTVTLNPAIDKVFFINELKRNITNRIKDNIDSIGGKGTHVSINLKVLGMASRAFGICYGRTGRQIIKILEEYVSPLHFIHHPQKNSRTNYVIIEDSGDNILIAEKGISLSERDIRDLLDLMQRETGIGDCLVLAGDASNAPSDIHNRIINELEAKKLRVFLDSSGKALKEGLSFSPFLIKPNLDELSFLCGRELSNDTDDIIDAIKSLSHYNIKVIAVSLGKNGSILYNEKGIYQARPPDVRAVSTTGCGDCFLAGLLYGYEKGLSTEETLRIATGASSAKAESALSAGFDSERMKSLAALTVIRKIR
jgi:1-phosphofructokinase family hexose kinase